MRKAKTRNFHGSAFVTVPMFVAIIFWLSGFTAFQNNEEMLTGSISGVIYIFVGYPSLLISFVILVLNFSKISHISNNLGNMAIMFLYVLAIGTIIYAPISRQTFDVWVGVVEITIVTAAFSLTASTPRECLDRIYKLLTIVLALCYLAVFLRPSAGIHTDDMFSDVFEDVLGGWRGIFWHKNVAAPICALLVIFSFSFKPSGALAHPFARLFVAMCAIVFVIFSTGKTALGLVGIMFVLYLGIRFSGAAISKFRVMLSILICAGLFTFFYVTLYYLEPNFDITFSNRTPIWKLHLDYWLLSPIFGHGYAGVFFPAGGGISSFATGWEGTMPHAHNAYLDMLGQLGVVGSAVLFFALARSVSSGLKLSTDDKEKEWALPATLLLVFCLLTGLMEGVVMSQRFIWTFTVVLMVMLNTKACTVHVPAKAKRLKSSINSHLRAKRPVASPNAYMLANPSKD